MNTIDIIYKEKCELPSDINEHLPTLKHYAEACAHVTEFGVRSIVSTWALLAARPAKLISYDINPPPNLQQVLNVIKETNIQFEFRLNNVLEITIEPTDMLFIDTLHQYGQIKKELELHADKVSKYIAFHDTYLFANIGEDKQSPGIWQAIQEFLDSHPEWTICEQVEYNNGLTVVKRNQPDA